MIQRIQSIFLALAGGGLFSLFGLPFASTPKVVDNSTLFANDNVYNLMDNMALLLTFVVAGLLALAAIFLFNNRKTQLLLTRLAIITTIIGFGLVCLFMMQDWESMANSIDDGIGAYIPAVSVILLGLAHRYINKDEQLVRSSYDRLR